MEQVGPDEYANIGKTSYRYDVDESFSEVRDPGRKVLLRDVFTHCS